jgi:hypothetical protein
MKMPKPLKLLYGMLNRGSKYRGLEFYGWSKTYSGAKDEVAALRKYGHRAEIKKVGRDEVYRGKLRHFFVWHVYWSRRKR